MANWRGGHILNILITFAHFVHAMGAKRQFRGGDFSPMRPVCNTAHTNKQTQLANSIGVGGNVTSINMISHRDGI